MWSSVILRPICRLKLVVRDLDDAAVLQYRKNILEAEIAAQHFPRNTSMKLSARPVTRPGLARFENCGKNTMGTRPGGGPAPFVTPPSRSLMSGSALPPCERNETSLSRAVGPVRTLPIRSGRRRVGKEPRGVGNTRPTTPARSRPAGRQPPEAGQPGRRGGSPSSLQEAPRDAALRRDGTTHACTAYTATSSSKTRTYCRVERSHALGYTVLGGAWSPRDSAMAARSSAPVTLAMSPGRQYVCRLPLLSECQKKGAARRLSKASRRTR